MDLDRVPLWRGDHVSIKQLTEDFARYLYLPRLAETESALDAINDGLTLLTWEDETFAYADGFDEATGKYRGLRHAQRVHITDADSGLVVKSEAARRQLSATSPVTSWDCKRQQCRNSRCTRIDHRSGSDLIHSR